MEVSNNKIYSSREVVGLFFEPYTPAAGRVKSPSLNKKLEYVRMYISADTNVTFLDYAGNLSSAVPLAKGHHDFLVREISVTSVANSVWIVHDGLVTAGEV